MYTSSKIYISISISELARCDTLKLAQSWKINATSHIRLGLCATYKHRWINIIIIDKKKASFNVRYQRLITFSKAKEDSLACWGALIIKLHIIIYETAKMTNIENVQNCDIRITYIHTYSKDKIYLKYIDTFWLSVCLYRINDSMVHGNLSNILWPTHDQTWRFLEVKFKNICTIKKWRPKQHLKVVI